MKQFLKALITRYTSYSVTPSWTCYEFPCTCCLYDLHNQNLKFYPCKIQHNSFSELITHEMITTNVKQKTIPQERLT